eukprot:1161373-Pelagomonas_calceolata.AAC.4
MGGGRARPDVFGSRRGPRAGGNRWAQTSRAHGSKERGEGAVKEGWVRRRKTVVAAASGVHPEGCSLERAGVATAQAGHGGVQFRRACGCPLVRVQGQQPGDCQAVPAACAQRCAARGGGLCCAAAAVAAAAAAAGAALHLQALEHLGATSAVAAVAVAEGERPSKPGC